MANSVKGWALEVSGDLGKIDAESKKMANLKLREGLQTEAAEALGPAADAFARASRAAFAARSPFDFGELDTRPGEWRGGVRARPFKKNVRISVMALGPHDLAKWNRGKMSHPFMGNRAKWYDRAVPDFKGVGRRTGEGIKPEVLAELGTSIAELLEQRLT